MLNFTKAEKVLRWIFDHEIELQSISMNVVDFDVEFVYRGKGELELKEGAITYEDYLLIHEEILKIEGKNNGK